MYLQLALVKFIRISHPLQEANRDARRCIYNIYQVCTEQPVSYMEAYTSKKRTSGRRWKRFTVHCLQQKLSVLRVASHFRGDTG